MAVPMPQGGARWEGLKYCCRLNGWSPKDGKWVFLMKVFDFLHIKCSNLLGQKTSKHVFAIFETKRLEII